MAPEDRPDEFCPVGSYPEPGPFSALFPGDEAGVDEQREMMADGGLAAIERFVEVAGAHLAFRHRGYEAEQAESHRVGQCLECRGQLLGFRHGERFVRYRDTAKFGRFHLLKITH